MMVRAVTIAAVLLVLLGIPLWMHKSRDPATVSAPRPAALAKKPVASAPATGASVALAPAILSGPQGQGVTLGVVPTQVPDQIALACQGHDGAMCHPQQGDTSCRVVLPVLCERTEGAELVLGATSPVMGAVLSSPAAAHQRCEAELGSGWHMASAPPQGVLQGRVYGTLSADTRYWVRSPQGGANCWGA